MSLLHQVGLTLIKNIGPASAKALLAHFGDAERIFKAPKSTLLKISGIGEKRTDLLDLNSVLHLAEAELSFMEKNEIKAIFYTDNAYPKRLKNCIDSPVLLYSKGNIDL